MNRFLTRKKDKDDAAGGKRKKGRKGQEEDEKPAFDLSSALPAADDFRTSLILPGLSTRFSMLKEQDDPTSKLGKASDDSVLQPKRQSRLHEFGFVPGGLSDIAEVSSLKSVVRPPFANSDGRPSFDSSRDVDSPVSIMSRARPGEGNVLFGGRQKIYVISNTSVKGTGRTLYDDDINLSAYQRLRNEEKEKEKAKQGLDPADQLSEPPSPSSSRKRETSSSTNSGPAVTRTSTAATSVASSGAGAIPITSPMSPPPTNASFPELARSTTKARRLYDQGLDQHIQEQQASSLNRLNSIQRVRGPANGRSTPPMVLGQAKSMANLSDRFDRGLVLRSASPVLSNQSRSRNNSSAESSPILSYPQSPILGSPTSDNDETYALKAALQPHDRGKATAMGAFNKPKEAFSEQQYAERLRALHQGSDVRNVMSPKFERPSPRTENALPMNSSPPPRMDNPVPRFEKPAPKVEGLPPTIENPEQRVEKSVANTEPPAPKTDDVMLRINNHVMTPATKIERPPRKPTLRERAELERKKRAEADTAQPEPVIAEEPAEKPVEVPDAFSRFQAAAERMKIANAAANLPVKAPSPPVQAQTMRAPPAPVSQNRASFLISPDASEAEDEPVQTSRPSTARRYDNLPVATGPAPSIFEHPALRSRSTSEEKLQHTVPSHKPSPRVEQRAPADAEGPTLTTTNGGLSGLIRQHLRHSSNISSIYDEQDRPLPDSPTTAAAGLAISTRDLSDNRRETIDTTPAPSSHSLSNPWDLDDIGSSYGDRESYNSTHKVDPLSVKPLALITPIEPQHSQSDWNLTPRRTHERIASTETEAEHEAFQRDLAQRQRVIQENLRARQEDQVVSAPGPTGGLKTALNMLRAKSSRESFATVDRPQDPRPVRKMTGVGSTNASSTSLAGIHEQWRPEGQLRPKPSRVLQQSEQDAHREWEQRQRSATDSSRTGRPVRQSPPVSAASSTRDRSNSNTSSNRSRSRSDFHRDDRDMPEMPRSVPFPSHDHPPPPISTRPSLDIQTRSRARSTSKPTPSNYFDVKHLHAIQTGPVSGASSPRLPVPKYSPGVPISPRPSPGGFHSPNLNGYPHSPVPPFATDDAPTPPVSNPATPNMPVFNPMAIQPMARQGMLRKKSVNKSDISEPVFISTTSVIDTVSLPPGASLKNGADAVAPPVPPINPMRKRFAFGRTEGPGSESNGKQSFDMPRAPFAEPVRTNSADGFVMPTAKARNKLRKTSSEGKSLHGRAHAAVMSPGLPPSAGMMAPSPQMQQGPMSAGPYAHRGSPPRPRREEHSGAIMEGGMF